MLITVISALMLAHVYTESVTWPAFGAVTIEHRIASHAVHKQIRVLEILFNQSRQLKQFRQFQVNDLPGRFILYDSLNGPQIYIKTSDLRYMCVCVCVCVCNTCFQLFILYADRMYD